MGSSDWAGVKNLIAGTYVYTSYGFVLPFFSKLGPPLTGGGLGVHQLSRFSLTSEGFRIVGTTLAAKLPVLVPAMVMGKLFRVLGRNYIDSNERDRSGNVSDPAVRES